MHPLYAPSFHWKGFTTLPYFALLQFPRRSMPDSLRFLSLVQTLKKHVGGGRGVRAPSGKGFLQPSSNREAAVLQDDYLYRERSPILLIHPVHFSNTGEVFPISPKFTQFSNCRRLLVKMAQFQRLVPFHQINLDGS